MGISKVVIPAAGLGTRFYPLTRAQPKEMLPIVDKPVIHYVVEEAVKSGLDEILIIVGKGKEAIINYFDRHDLDAQKMEDYGLSKFPEIFFVRQREQRGLGDAIRCAEKFVDDEPFAVLLGDTIYTTNSTKTVTRQLIDASQKTGATTIAIEEVPHQMTKNYGIIKGKEISKGLWKIDGMVEKPEPGNAPSRMAIAGNYILQPEIFDYLRKIKPGKNGEYQLTDALNMMCKSREVYGCRFNGTRYDIGNKALWIKTFIDFAKRAGY